MLHQDNTSSLIEVGARGQLTYGRGHVAKERGGRYPTTWVFCISSGLRTHLPRDAYHAKNTA
eukprot:3457075-Prymnesium_polylepis.1